MLPRYADRAPDAHICSVVIESAYPFVLECTNLDTGDWTFGKSGRLEGPYLANPRNRENLALKYHERAFISGKMET